MIFEGIADSRVNLSLILKGNRHLPSIFNKSNDEERSPEIDSLNVLINMSFHYKREGLHDCNITIVFNLQNNQLFR